MAGAEGLLASTSVQENLPLSMEEYLQSDYEPDCEFVDGRLEERNVGETKHGILQMQLGFWFISHSEWNVTPISELRTRVSASRVRLPDVSVVSADDALDERVRLTPPLLAIEILSPQDRMNRVLIRLGDFLEMGTQNIWLLDPDERVAYTFSSHGLKLVQTPLLNLAGSPIFLDLPVLFSSLDRPSRS